MQEIALKYQRNTMEFISHGEKCTAWFYLPECGSPPPVVIMAHGFAAEKNFALPKYAEKFASEGLAVLLFDYRCFGESTGNPRNYVNPFHHVEDWKSAVKFIKSCDKIDNKKIALWGSSFSGGHVIYAGAQIKGLSAIVSQVPHVDGIALMFKSSPIKTLNAIFYSLLDIFSTYLSKKPYYVKVVGAKSEFAAMNSEESLPGYTAMIPKNSKWENKVPAKIFLLLLLYSPLLKAKKVKYPTLVIAARHDSLIPYKAVKLTAMRIRRVDFISLGCNHFAPYMGKWHEQCIAAELLFLKKHLI